MDFFTAQDRARRRTWLLVALFVIAVAAIAAAVHTAFVGSWWWSLEGRRDWPLLVSMFRDVRTILATGSVTILVIAIASAYEIRRLSLGGGAVVAQSLGGRLIGRSSHDAQERRLLNIVDEIAIASGVPVPPVYVLDGEAAINAFAAGFAPHQAVVAVTRGALDNLDRDELQGVIAHEFSHILNGDMRLNIVLMGVVYGLLALHLLGREVMDTPRGRSDDDGRGRAAILLMGLSLLVIGWIGWLFGQLIKAAVSRQREFLADAAAVQFTRYPAGIVGALAKIGGATARLQHPRAEEVSHMYFCDGASNLFASHPPIVERLERLTGMPWMQAEGATSPTDEPVAAFADARRLVDALPPAVASAVTTPVGAKAVVLALLAARDPDCLAEAGDEPVDAARKLLSDVQAMPDDVSVAVVDLAVPALVELSRGERARFLKVLDAMIAADGQASVFERAVAQLLRAALKPSGGKAKGGSIGVAAARVLAALAHAGHADEGAARAAYAAALDKFPAARTEPMAERGEAGPWPLKRALTVLASAPPLKKRRLMEAAHVAVAFDGVVTDAERRIMAMVAQSLGIPSMVVAAG